MTTAKRRTRELTARVTPTEDQRIRQHAMAQGLSLPDWMRRAIRDAIIRERNQPILDQQES